MRLIDLLGCEVETESGEKLHRVWDVRTEETEGGLRLVGLLIGRHGLLERLGLLSWRQMRRHGERIRPDVDVVPWDSVLRIDKGVIIVRDGTRAERV
jgi:sporulation protein YlmC with PRC-barrel domain